MTALLALLFAFAKIALIDSYDYMPCCDVETKAGTSTIVDNALKTGATHVFWRAQSGSVPRYPSIAEDRRKLSAPLDKRRIGWDTVWGWSRLDRGADCTNLIAEAFAELRRRGIVTGIHYMFEENHCSTFTLGQWNLEHPQYWNRKKGKTPFHGRCSFAYDEVLAHKMEFLDELLAMKPDAVCLDLFRSGEWSVESEYVPKLMDEFRAIHGEEPPDDYRDERWLKLCAKYTERYLRAVAEHCHAAGAKFYFELSHLAPWGKDDRYHWRRYALDWKKLAAEGVFDAIVVAAVNIDEKDAFGSLKATYEYIRANRGKARILYHCSAYDWARGIGVCAKATGLGKGEVARRLLEIAKECNGEGVVMECVDWDNYTDEINHEIRKF